MRAGEHDVARAYVLYREERARSAPSSARRRPRRRRAARASTSSKTAQRSRSTWRELDGAGRSDACEGLGRDVDAGADPARRRCSDLYDGVPMDEVRKSLILAARALIEQDPATATSPRACCSTRCACEMLGEEVTQADMRTRYAEYFPSFIKQGIDAELLDERLGALRPEAPGRGARRRTATCKFSYLGLQTSTTATSCTCDGRRIELPQAFFMRVAMGLALNEDRAAKRARSSSTTCCRRFDFMSSTPTLFNSGTRRSQLVELLPHHRRRRPRRHLRGDQGKRAAVRSTPAASATTGRRCARSAPTSRAPTASRRAWCRS